jgi:Tfp pilus assembly protein PilN
MIKINLVPAEILAKARQRQLVIQASAIGLVLSLVLALISVAHWFSLHQLNNDYKYKEAKLQKLSVIVSEVEQLEKSAAAVRARLGVIDSLLKGRAYYPIFMSQFAATVPSGVTVTNVGTAPKKGKEGDTLTLTISAEANSNDDIAAWLRVLGGDTHFSSVELGPVHAAGKVGYTFSVTTDYTLKL